MTAVEIKHNHRHTNKTNSFNGSEWLTGGPCMDRAGDGEVLSAGMYDS